jgi:hypothetical protein
MIGPRTFCNQKWTNAKTPDLKKLNATGRLTLAEIAQAALDTELEENDFDWQAALKMREPAPEPTEPAPPQPSEPSEPAPEPEQPEPAPPAPQSASLDA